MDFASLAKQGYAAYQSSQSGHQGQDQSQPFGVQGSAALNSSDNNRPPAQGMNIDPNQIAQQASAESGHDSSLFASALSFLNSNDKDDHLDEEQAQKAHAQAFEQGNTANMSSQSLGAAAAMNALKKFTSGNSPQQQQQQSGGNMQSSLIAMALAEAQKLFASKPTGTANQQDIMSSAGQTMFKLLLKNQMSGTVGAGSEGGKGGMSQLLGMAQSFMK